MVMLLCQGQDGHSSQQPFIPSGSTWIYFCFNLPLVWVRVSRCTSKSTRFISGSGGPISVAYVCYGSWLTELHWTTCCNLNSLWMSALRNFGRANLIWSNGEYGPIVSIGSTNRYDKSIYRFEPFRDLCCSLRSWHTGPFVCTGCCSQMTASNPLSR